MTSYVANYQKKLRICAKQEEKLRRLVSRRAAEAKLLRAAELVRDARVRAQRAKRESVSPADVPALRAEIARFNAMIEATASMTAAEVLAEFRKPLVAENESS